MKGFFIKLLVVLVPAAVGIITWEVLASSSTRTAFLFGRPTDIAEIILARISSGSVFGDALATAIPAVSGFVAGNLGGIAIGLILWRFSFVGAIVRPYLITLGAVPAFVFAPVLVVWFGTGDTMRIAVVFLSTVFVATAQGAAGAAEVSKEHLALFKTYKASSGAIFRHLILPGASAWVFAGMRLNVGFALLGAFVGEFISADKGLARRALTDAALYNISGVWASALMIAILSLVLYSSVVALERLAVPWKKTS